MGRIAKILSFLRVTRRGAKLSDVKVDPGGGPNVTAEHSAPAGDDSFPLDTDYAVLLQTPRSGSEVVVGYFDPLNTPKAEAGDKRIYARDSNGAVIVEVWLKNDGTGILSNANGSFTLSPDGSTKGLNSNGSFELQQGGDFLVNGVNIDTSGNITTPGTLNADDVTADNQDVTLSTHTTPSFGVPPTPGT